MAWRDVLAVEPAREQEPHAGRHRVGQRPVEHLARAGVLGVDQHDVDGAVAHRRQRGIAGGEGLDHERHPLADPADVGERFAAVELRAAEAERVDDLDDPLLRLVAEHADGDRPRTGAGAGSRPPSPGVTWRGLPGAKLNPRASAPSATARRASSSLVTPQILTNIGVEGTGPPSVARVHSRPVQRDARAPRRTSDATSSEACATGCRSSRILVAYLVLHELGDDARAGRPRRPAARVRQVASSAAPPPTVRLQRRAVGPGEPALVRLRRLARVPQPLRRDARRSRSCCGCAPTRCSAGSGRSSSRSRSPGSSPT